MARLKLGLPAVSFLAWLDWSVRRSARLLQRKLGMAGLTLALCGLVVLSSWAVHRKAMLELAALGPVASVIRRPAVEPVSVAGDDDDAQLDAFQAYLLAAEDIPQVIQDLIALADAHRLQMYRGDYKALQEPRGRFLRYQMTLPVKGDAQAVQHFIAAALEANKTLALEAVNFKRETLASTLVEARIQWVLLTRLPEHGGARERGARS